MKADITVSGYSDDCANFSGEGVDDDVRDMSEYKIGGKWFALTLDGRRIGAIRITYDGEWTVQLQGTDLTLGVERIPAEDYGDDEDDYADDDSDEDDVDD